MEIQRALDQSDERVKCFTDTETSVTLSVKIGVGVGDVAVLYIGGDLGRAETVAVGAPLDQAFAAEHLGVAGHVVCSREAWALVREHFNPEAEVGEGFVRVSVHSQVKTALRKTRGAHALTAHCLSALDHADAAALETRLESYIPRSVLANLRRESRESEKWANEICTVVVLFVNLGLDEALLNRAANDRADPSHAALNFVHATFAAAQKAVYEYEGSVNKFLHDDKGSTLIACWGLPPHAHADDPERAALAALRLAQLLAHLGLTASVGLTVGEVFCGITGSVARRESH